MAVYFFVKPMVSHSTSRARQLLKCCQTIDAAHVSVAMIHWDRVTGRPFKSKFFWAVRILELKFCAKKFDKNVITSHHFDRLCEKLKQCLSLPVLRSTV